MGGGCLLASQYLWLSVAVFLLPSIFGFPIFGFPSLSLALDIESGGSSPFPPLVNTESGFTSGGSSPFPPVGYRSDGSSPFPHVGYIWWVFSVSSCRSHRQVGLLHFLLCFARFPPVGYIEGMWVDLPLSLELDTESGGSSPFPPLDTESGGSSPFPPLNTESGGSSPFSPVENQMGLLHFLLAGHRIRWVFSG
ncbi:unnamed protein product [Rodentolepis nana]|uniref:Secreted protein n=1 Tax=Rodentolepis nana TaxID=102285 RepID=A0A0R3T156_RODNA|nr:unnamed protein product [Rodentolepis nana]